MEILDFKNKKEVIDSSAETWHKCLCLVFRKLGIIEMLITDNDLLEIQALKPEDMPAMVVASDKDGTHLVLTNQKEASEFKNATELRSK